MTQPDLQNPPAAMIRRGSADFAILSLYLDKLTQLFNSLIQGKGAF